MSQHLAFMEAYHFHSKQRDFKSRALMHLSHRIGEKEVNDELIKVAALLSEERTPTVMRQIKNKLKQIPASFSNFMGVWNHDGLNILHHSIVNNCPEIVEFLLIQPNWFPPSLMPDKNPYAHLAALFGFADCLKLILKYRPTDFFSGSQPTHCIKLPIHIRKLVKVPDPLRSVGKKNTEKLLSKIKFSSETAEMEIKHASSAASDISEFDGLSTHGLDIFQTGNLTPRSGSKKLRGFVVVTEPITDGKRIPIRARRTASETNVPQTSTVIAVVKKPSKEGKNIAPPQKTEKTDDAKCKTSYCEQQKISNKKHIITVHWGLFSQAPKGVVQGAGKKVHVKYSESALSRPQNIQINEMGRTLTVPYIKTPLVRQLQDKLSGNRKTNKQKSTTHRRNRPISTPTVLEHGIRGRKKYKEFHLVETPLLDVKDEAGTLKNKTPLAVAAQYGHLECVKLILESYIMKRHPNVVVKEPLTLATKAKSPDAIMLLMNQKVSRTDFQSAVLLAIREMYPDCLTTLLVPHKNKDRQTLFDGINLYHILYTQCLLSDYRYEMLPTMTNVLINSNEDVNSHNVHSTFPMYTLINCAFNITKGSKVYYYVECLKILLENKANPHYDEGKAPRLLSYGLAFSRSAYSSAINCILESAVNSVNFFESTFWSKIFMKKFLVTLIANDRTSRRLLNDALFNYMNTVCLLGIDRYIVKCLLRYGANSDFRNNGKYAINTYFDNTFPYLARFQVTSSQSKREQELGALMMICNSMSYSCLKEAKMIFLNEHFLNCPIQALTLCRSFAYLINVTLRSPRSLTEQTAQFIWIRLKRNEKRVRMLSIPEKMIAFIIP